MRTGIHVMVSDGPVTRLGQLRLAGEVVDAEPTAPRSLRAFHGYVLSVVISGRGSFRRADGDVRPLGPGTVTLVRPDVPHWYGTAPGERWTELFAVFAGPLFDTLAASAVIPESGPREARGLPSSAALRSVLDARPRSDLSAEHQLLALSGWLVEANQPAQAAKPSPPIAAAADRLADDLTAELDLRAVAAAVGLPYDTFRRRFAAEVGQPPLAYRNGRRLQAAANLLRMTDLTIATIARTLGYVDEFHLSRRFRARYGSPPSAYRRR